MGRMAAHTGQEVTFDQILNSDHEFAPNLDKLTMTSDAPFARMRMVNTLSLNQGLCVIGNIRKKPAPEGAISSLIDDRSCFQDANLHGLHPFFVLGKVSTLALALLRFHGAPKANPYRLLPASLDSRGSFSFFGSR